MNLEKDLSFYQSTDVIYTPVDFSNPLHRDLLKLVVLDEVPSKEANKLMKKAGFQSQISENNTIIWSSDLFLRSNTLGHLSFYSSIDTNKEIKDQILEYLGTF